MKHEQCLLTAIMPKAEILDSSGDVASGSMAAARKVWRFAKYEHLKYVNALHNSLQAGAGLSLDQHLPVPIAPDRPEATDPQSLGALVFLGDMEGRQRLG